MAADLWSLKPIVSSLPGNGYCRSEAAVAVLLTKKSMAKRVYATVLNAGNNTDGYKEQGTARSAISFILRRQASDYSNGDWWPHSSGYLRPSPFPQCLVAHLRLASVSKCNAETERVKWHSKQNMAGVFIRESF